jgi:uracil-DNA glycosylase
MAPRGARGGELGEGRRVSGRRGALPTLSIDSLEHRLEQHHAALSGCRRCGFEGDVVPILSEARAPRVMLVGQAPGKSEISDRRAFAGRAGRTLFRWLARAGVDEETVRASIHIAAVTRCYPGPSASGRGDRVPSPRERALCGVWLDDELRLIRPELLIPVGRLAIDRFLGPVALDDVVGHAHTVRHLAGESIAIPLPHPSGASSWIHAPGHAVLLERALDILGRALVELGITPTSAGRSVA